MVRKRVYKGHSLVENVDDYTVLDIETQVWIPIMEKYLK